MERKPMHSMPKESKIPPYPKGSHKVGEQGRLDVIQYPDGSQSLVGRPKPKANLSPGSTVMRDLPGGVWVMGPGGKQDFIPKR